ncbi:hypothetical protein [Kineosporia sp. A_224]|uniref:hypothetical protein n=1 Tax=Kineosporia sp. A_224 TaxID=1962180 RepID=UPI000B4AB1E2|nr:hypothetical protein [Kineosporia sp. A_224]
MTSPLRQQAASRIRAATAQITATAEARLADLSTPGRRTRARRAAEQAARREVWAWRAAEIARVTAAIRAETRAAENEASRRRSQAHRAATRARAANARMDRQARHTERALYEEQERSL